LDKARVFSTKEKALVEATRLYPEIEADK